MAALPQSSLRALRAPSRPPSVALVPLKGMPWAQALPGQNVNQEPVSAGEAMATWTFFLGAWERSLQNTT